LLRGELLSARRASLEAATTAERHSGRVLLALRWGLRARRLARRFLREEARQLVEITGTLA
jgi:hypothetical protein